MYMIISASLKFFLETDNIYPADVINDIPGEEIEEYLLEEFDGSDPLEFL